MKEVNEINKALDGDVQDDDTDLLQNASGLYGRPFENNPLHNADASFMLALKYYNNVAVVLNDSLF